MKTKSLIILCLIVILCSCTQDRTSPDKISYDGQEMTEQLTQRNFDSSKAVEEMTRERTETRIPFTMNYSECLGKPVIELDTDRHIYVMVDSGCTRNWYFSSFIEKANLSEDEFMRIIIQDIRKNEPEISNGHPSDEEFSTFLKNEWENYNLNYLAKVYINNISLRYDSVQKQSYDGVLGADFLMAYDRVTFDYINNYMILNDKKLDGTEIPFIQTDNSEILINFTYNGQQELAMIDTGNYCFTPRHNIGDGKQDYDIDDYSSYALTYNDDVPVTPRIMQTYDNIQIGGVTYSNIKGAYSTIEGSGFNKGAQLHMMKLNNLGNVFFYDHIIQFDFVDKVFIIK